MHSAAFFKTKRSKSLPMLKSSQIKVFCDLEDIHKIQELMIFQNLGPPLSCHLQFLIKEVGLEVGRLPFLARELLVFPKIHGYHHLAAIAALPCRWHSVITDLNP